jgi:predicted nuclease with RNAse H fold
LEGAQALHPHRPPAGQVVATYVGIDVGGRRKGFHACAVAGGGPEGDAGTLAGARILAGPERLGDVGAAVEWVAAQAPAAVGLDSPKTCAAPGERSRVDEREFAAAKICNIRWTPAASELAGNPYYEWIEHGLELYAALARALPNAELIEVFPTASWTVWSGPRAGRDRIAWSAAALAAIAPAGLPTRRLSQDDRDAVAAALTTRLHGEGRARSFGAIVVPAARAA